jgi:hypothetical protein
MRRPDACKSALDLLDYHVAVAVVANQPITSRS